MIVNIPDQSNQTFVPFDTEILRIHHYGRALTRGVIFWKRQVWIVCLKRGKWYLEIPINEVKQTGGIRNTTFKNYLKRVGLWKSCKL